MPEIFGALILGATTVMLRPNGNMDLMYIMKILTDKQISYMFAVPAWLNALCDFLDKPQVARLQSIRSISIGGETVSSKLIERIKSIVTTDCLIWNDYGPAEMTISSTCYRVDSINYLDTVPIGRPLPNYRCIIHDEFGQPVAVGQQGELLIGGVGVFAGYFGRDDLTSKVLVEIEDKIYYKTGDLVRMDRNGLIYYIGRKDHQVKLHGQQIEVGEIEQCLLRTHIAACVVAKYREDHLVAYVQGSGVNENDLRSHCRSSLPPFMVPSMFVMLDHLPLNANGKVDRKRLPAPDFSPVSNADPVNFSAVTPLEERLRGIFAEAFHNEIPDVNVPFGQMGGTSLDAIRALSMIREKICTKVDATLLFANPSVRQLALALEPLVVVQEKLLATSITAKGQEDTNHPTPSLLIEAVGIMLLAVQWLFPMWLAYRSHVYFSVKEKSSTNVTIYFRGVTIDGGFYIVYGQ
ncbi:unnamed protein product [Rotaria sp. Silwood2]|nr:unnamed protein product [Rotaria sp. Silwood2]